jgi:SAM-dependent methyltransferase
VRTPIRNPPVPVYAEFETHRTLIRDRVRTEAFARALEAVVRPGDRVLDVGAGSGILSLLAARAGAARVYAVEQTSIARLAEELAAANGLADVVEVVQGDVRDVELPGKVDVLVSEWLGGFGIDEGMLLPVLVARDRWLEPGGTMIPSVVSAWTALVHDSYVEETMEFLRSGAYGFDLRDLAEKTANEVFYSGPMRHLAVEDLRSEPAPLWTTDTARISIQDARRPHAADVRLPIRAGGVANALGLWFSADLAAGVTLAVGPGDPPTHWGMTTAPLREPLELRAGSVTRVRVRTEPARTMGTWTSWAVEIGDGTWEEHDEQSVWTELVD